MRGRFVLGLLLATACGAWRGTAETVSLDLRPQPDMPRLLSRDAAGTRAYDLPCGAARTRTPLRAGDELEVRLSDDVAYRLRLGPREETPLAPAAFVGYSDGVGVASVVEGAEGLDLSLFGVDSPTGYTVVSTREAVRVTAFPLLAVACSTPETHGTPDATETEGATAPARRAIRRAAESGASVEPGAAVPLVDLLVAYEAGARAYAEAQGGGLTNFALSAVAKMNAALSNTEIDRVFRFRLVGVTAVSAETKSVNTALKNASQGRAGWESVKAERDRVGADVVTVLVETGSAYGVTGLANPLTESVRDFFENQAYSACSIRGVQQGHSMTHEVGHNLGAGHATELYNQQSSYRGPQLEPYSSGHYFTGEDDVDYYTIMSYRDDGTGRLYTLVPYFSSPDYLYKGREVGDAYHDNTRTLKETGRLASTWRAQVVPRRDEIAFAPNGGSHFASTVTVTLTAGAAAEEVRYTLDGTPPTLASPRYARPLVLTETTTVRAAAVLDGEIAPFFAATYTKSDFGVALGLPQLVWTTSADYPWTVDASGSERAVRSGDGGRYWNQPSELWTTVVGPTALGFRTRLQGMSNYAFLRVSVSGETRFETRTASPETWQAAEVTIPDGTHEVRFRFEVEGGRNPEYGYNGAWLTGLRLSAPPATDTPMPVPHAWLARYPTLLAQAGGDHDAAARLVGANGLAVWESYLAGLDPTNAHSQLTARIALKEGKPEISWEPDLGAARVYRLRGKRELSEGWREVRGDADDYRFFQVLVEPNP